MHEISVAFGPDKGLIGTLTLPAAAGQEAPAPLAMILFNAGVVHRIGPHRINVKLARELALHGLPTMRFDLHGMGDSLGATGKLSYEQQVVSDLCAAMDTLQDVTGVRHFAVLGFCSGALPSYWVAQHDARVRHIILYDAFALQTPKSRRRLFVTRLIKHCRDPVAIVSWLRRSARILPRMLKTRLPRGSVESAPSFADAPSNIQMSKGFMQLAQRGVHVSLLQSGADFSNVNYASQIAECFGFGGAATTNLRTGWLASIDHIMTSTSAQRDFANWICADVLADEHAAPNAGQHVVADPLPAMQAQTVR